METESVQHHSIKDGYKGVCRDGLWANKSSVITDPKNNATCGLILDGAWDGCRFPFVLPGEDAENSISE